MSFVSTKGRFHVALNGVGVILQGAPERPAYVQQQAPLYGARFASGDRTYNDLSKWWYWAQTDWSGGIKDSTSWADDAKFFAASNIDTITQPEAFKLAKDISLEKTFADYLTVGIFGEVANAVLSWIGTESRPDNNAKVYKRTAATAWTEIAGTTLPTTADLVRALMPHKNVLFGGCGGTQTTYTVWKSTNGTAITDDITGDITTALTLSNLRNCNVIEEDGSVMYLALDKGTDNNYYLIKTADAGATYVKLLDKASSKTIIDMKKVGTKLYYLLAERTVINSNLELRVYETADSSDAFVYTFVNAAGSNVSNNVSYAKRLLHLIGEDLIIVNSTGIWSYNLTSGTIAQVVFIDQKHVDLGQEYRPQLGFGGVSINEKLYLGNGHIFYKGALHGGMRDISDGNTYSLYPFFADSAGTVFWFDNNDGTKVYIEAATYRHASGKNWMLFSNLDSVSALDKLAFAFTVLFPPLITGQKIIVEYFTGELTSSSTFTELGRVDYAVDGGVITDATFLFPAGTTYKKIWYRVKLESSGSDTPVVSDTIAAYLPTPSPLKNWNLNINCGDDVKRLDGGLAETTGRELKALLEKAWWTKSVLDFQDLDYATTAINNASNMTASATSVTVDDTRDFPEQGRIKIDNEEIFYTGKTPTSFTGLTRGVRDTKAVAHLDDAVVNNAYKVIIISLEARVPVANKDKELEYIVSISLREA